MGLGVWGFRWRNEQIVQVIQAHAPLDAELPALGARKLDWVEAEMQASEVPEAPCKHVHFQRSLERKILKPQAVNPNALEFQRQTK